MQVSDPLGLAVREMQQDGYADRVKKLVYFICTSTWESDAHKLSQVDLKTLLEQLCREHSTLEALGQRFRDAVRRINKKAEYARIAKLVLSKLQPLYRQPQAPSPLPSAGAPSAGIPSLSALAPESVNLHLQKQEYDPFELRAGIMRQTTPLRAKLVLFTALYHKLEPTLQGLAALRRYSLDDLVKTLYDACPSPQELENRLKQAVQQLQEPEQDGQAATAVLQMLKPLYVYVEVPPEPVAEDSPSADLDWLNGEDPHPGRITWLESGIPAHEDGEAPPPAIPTQELPETCRQLLSQSAASLMATIENTLSELGNALDEELQDEDPAQYLTLKHQVLRGLLKDVEGSATVFMGILQQLEHSERRLIQPELSERVGETPVAATDPYAALRQVLAISELTRQKPQLEQEVMRLVRRSIGSIKAAIERELSDLGGALDEQFQTRPLEEALSLKYQTLRTFLQEVERISTKFAALLDRMEEAERRLYGLT